LARLEGAEVMYKVYRNRALPQITEGEVSGELWREKGTRAWVKCNPKDTTFHETLGDARKRALLLLEAHAHHVETLIRELKELI
jgi:hypothetical protein